MTELNKRMNLSDQDFLELNKEQLIQKWKLQDKYIDSLEEKLKTLENYDKKYKDLEDAKNLEISRLKNLLLMKYVIREQDNQNQLQDMQNLISTTKIRQTFVDPSVNIVLNQLKKELDENRKQKEDALNELNAYKFTSESQMGKRLMAKCRKLIQENEELGKIISSGNIANLECDVTYHKRLLNEAYETEKSLHLFLNEMDTEMVRNK